MKQHKPKVDYYLLSPTEIYKLVLSGKPTSFPRGFWSGPDAVENAVEILRYLFETILQWSSEDIKKNYSRKLFKEYKLEGMFSHVFKSSLFQTINAVYPNQFKIWEISCVSNNYWQKPENAIVATKWLLEEKLKWTPKDIKEKIDVRLFRRYGLSAMLEIYHDSVWQAINAAYPNQFKEWELKNVPRNFWNEETGIRAVKWLIEDKLKWDENDIKEKISTKVFNDNGLGAMLDTIYHSSAWQAINTVYPNQFKEWELPNTSKNFWNEETGFQATKWLIEDKLRWTKDDIQGKINTKVFKDNGLESMLRIVYHGSPWQAINAVYPNRFKEWELPSIPINFWNQETAIRAVKWLIEDKLKWSEREVKGYLCLQTFTDYGFSHMINKIFDNDPYQAVNAAYPGQFQRSDFSRKKQKVLVE